MYICLIDFFVTIGIVIHFVNDILNMVHLLNTGSLYQKNNYERAITQKQNSNGTISVLSCIAEN